MSKRYPCCVSFPLLATGWLVLMGGADRYQAVCALPEIDSAFAVQTILLADQLDWQPLPAKNAPYQLVVPLEKQPVRWVRQLAVLCVVKVHEPVDPPRCPTSS